MSNVKEISASGIMPFDVYEDVAAISWLGLMNCPTIGIRITYGESHYEPNTDGSNGKTAYYRFTIEGLEAMRWEMLQRMKAEFEAAGVRFDRFDIDDIEA